MSASLKRDRQLRVDSGIERPLSAILAMSMLSARTLAFDKKPLTLVRRCGIRISSPHLKSPGSKFRQGFEPYASDLIPADRGLKHRHTAPGQSLGWSLR